MTTATSIASIMLSSFARPSPAFPKAVPWSTDVRIIGRPMLAYYRLIEEGWNKFDDPVNYATTNQTYYGKFVIQAGIAEAAQAALDRAWAAADAEARVRIQPIKDSFEQQVQSHELVEASAVYSDIGKDVIVSSFDFNEGPWTQAEVVNKFKISGTTDGTKCATEVRLLWDETNLYVAYNNFDDNMDACITSGVNEDTNWWISGFDDDIETYLAAAPDAKDYYACMSNSNGDVLLYQQTINGPAPVNGGGKEIETHAQRFEDRWAVIQVIPLRLLGVDRSNADAIYGYFLRTYHFNVEAAKGVWGWCGAGAWSAADLRKIKLEGRQIPDGGSDSGSNGGNINVKPALKPKHECPSRVFCDVDTDKWYHEAIDYVLSKGIMNGVSGYEFMPDRPLTRGMIVQMLYNLEGKPATYQSIFDDVKPDDWFAKAVNWAGANNIVSGYGTGLFMPDLPISREQMAVIFYNYANYKKYHTDAAGDLKKFTDGQNTAAWAITAMQWAVGNKVISGKPNAILDPAGGATRAEAAQIFMNFLERVSN